MICTYICVYSYMYTFTCLLKPVLLAKKQKQKNNFFYQANKPSTRTRTLYTTTIYTQTIGLTEWYCFLFVFSFALCFRYNVHKYLIILIRFSNFMA